MPGEEQQKLTQEYKDYQMKLEQQKADYRKDHPDAVSKTILIKSKTPQTEPITCFANNMESS